MNNNKKVIITGGTGFIGSRVAARFVAAGWKTYLYDSFVMYLMPDHAGSHPNYYARLEPIRSQVEIVRGSTLDKDHLRRTINEIKPSVILHTAAMPLAALALKHTEEAFQSILMGTHNILEVARDADWSPRVVYVSSSMVYGDFLSEVVTEEHPTNPRDIYGAFKLGGEIMVRAYAKNYKLDTAIIRPSAVYGPYDANQRVLEKFIRNAQAGKPIVMDGDGSMKLDFTYVDDTALGMFLVATHANAKGETFNITRGEGRSLKDAATIIQNYYPDLKCEYRPKPAHVPLRGALCIDKARKLVGFEPEVPLEEGLKRYHEHLKTQSF